MKIYTLFYKETGLYNHNIFVMPNDAAAKEAMRLNLAESKNERFKIQVETSDVELHRLTDFDEEKGITEIFGDNIVCNLKELLPKEDKNDETH